jgi:hypothetical protein
MSLTERTRWEELAGALFDELVVAHAASRRAGDSHDYFPQGRDDRAATYFVEPSVRVMEASDFEPHIGHAAGLLDALAASWDAQGETELSALVPRMRRIAEALADDNAQSDGTVDVLCYTLF